VAYETTLGTVFPSPEPTRANFTFNGWYTKADDSGAPVLASVKVTSDMTLYAHWRVSNSIALLPEGGVMPQGAKDYIVVHPGEQYPLLPTPTKEGYTFLGWYTTQTEGGVQAKPNEPLPATIPSALYARWEAKKVTVRFDFNGSGGTREPKTLSYGEAYGSLPLARWDGKTFLGWFTENVGGQQVTADTKVSITEDHTLYAHWGFVISFDPGRGSGTMDNDTAPAGSDYTFPPCTMTPPSGMTFLCWAVDSLKGERYSAGEKHTFTHNATLFAIWTESPITITATAGIGGSLTTVTGLTGQIVVEKGSDLTLIATPDRGYRLVDLQIDGNSFYAKKTYTFQDLEEDHTIHAVFEVVDAKDYLTCNRDIHCPLVNFTDLNPYEWYHDAIHYCLDEVIMNGNSATKYAPSQKANRAMLAMILWRAEGCPNPVGYGSLSKPFKDVNSSDWFYKCVLWAAKEGIVNGYSNGNFGPLDKITREQVVTMLWRYAGQPAPSPDTRLPFYDSWAVNNYAWDAMCWATEVGVINGRSNGMLDPRGNASRAEIAQMILNFLEEYGGKK